MKGYRKASKFEIKCEHCHYGRVPKAKGQWWECGYYFETLGSCAYTSVGRRNTCAHAADKLLEGSRARLTNG